MAAAIGIEDAENVTIEDAVAAGAPDEKRLSERNQSSGSVYHGIKFSSDSRYVT